MPLRPPRFIRRLKEYSDDAQSAHVVEDLGRDVKHMGRGLRKSPGFTIAVVLTLALGIGGNTAIFSVVDQLLLRPLPYPDGEQLLTIYESFAGEASGGRTAVSFRRPTGSTGSARIKRCRGWLRGERWI